MLAIMFVSIIGVIPTIPTVYAQETCGPKCDKVIHKVIKSPDDAVFAMQTGIADVYTDLMRTADIKTLDADGCTITQNLGFHIGFIAYNIRDTETIQAYYRPEISYWPLHDVQFRHALVHCYNQLAIVPEIYGYIITPVRSLVPPSQSKYYNANVPMHPYNPGDPFTSPAGEHSTCGILKGADYTFEDADSSGTVTDADYWTCPDGSPMPYLEIWTPFSEVNPTSSATTASRTWVETSTSTCQTCTMKPHSMLSWSSTALEGCPVNCIFGCTQDKIAKFIVVEETPLE